MTKLSLPLALFFAAAVRASEPGQPPDCSDWAFAESGYTCGDYNAYPATTGFRSGGTVPVQDNVGQLYTLRFFHSTIGSCGKNALYRHMVTKLDGPSEAPFAWIDDKCVDDVTGDRYYVAYPEQDPEPGRLVFLPKDGRMLIPLRLVCARPTSSECPPDPAGQGGNWVAMIEGFTTLFQTVHSPQRSTSRR